MQRIAIPPSILALALSACVVEPELLNSERIRQQFGSYGIQVISSDDALRRSNLYSLDEAGRRICRTYAVVRFDHVPASIVGDEHADILAGESIGATFKARGWSIYKETRYLGEYRDGPRSTQLARLMGEQAAQPLAMHVYRLLLKKGSQTVDYATIVEVHHPDYLTVDDIASLYVIDAPLRLSTAELQSITDLIND